MTGEFDALAAAQSNTPIEPPTEEPKEETEAVEAKEEPKEEPKEEIKEESGTLEVSSGYETVEHQVPLHHLLRERGEKNELKSELAELRKEIEALREGVTPKPEFDDDPKAYFDANLKKVEAKTSDFVTKDQLDEQMNYMQTHAAIQQDHLKVMSKHADYIDALNYVREKLYQQNLMNGIPPEQIKEVIDTAEMNMARDVLSKGGSPGETIYQYAVENMGYKPKGKKKDAVDDKIENIKKGQAASTPMPSGDGGSFDSEENKPDAFDIAFAETFGKK